jgi:NhaP-type Na+/H+ or K+/H+ antiporter
VDTYDLALTLAGVAILGAAVVPRLLAERPLSFPVVYILAGMAAFALPFGLARPDPVNDGESVEHLTELVVLISLMGSGLRLDRPVGWKSWKVTWRLLAVAMPITIAGAAFLGWWMLGFLPATALLLGAVLAPTDPVLASDVQVGPPGEEEEDEVRFALTSEAGLNDGLAFPFTNAAIAALGAATLGDWVGGWFLEDVLLKLFVGVLVGFLVGRGLAWAAFRLPKASGRLAESAEGFVAIAATLLAYGLGEIFHGYGFLSVFVAAVTLRDYERGHDYHQVLHEFAESTERLLMAGMLVLLGGAVVGGVLEPLTLRGAVFGLVLVLVLRPLSGAIALLGIRRPARERAAIAFFGIRGLGSAYYLAHALQEGDFGRADELWAVVTFVILVSAVLHGLTATPVMLRLEQRRANRRQARERAGAPPEAVDEQSVAPVAAAPDGSG